MLNIPSLVGFEISSFVTCQVTFTARDVGVSIRIRGMVQDGYVRDISMVDSL